MEDNLTKALERGDYDIALKIIENQSQCSGIRENTRQILFTKFHLLAITYARQERFDLAEKVYHHALCCMMDVQDLNPQEAALFLKNYCACLRHTHKDAMAGELEAIANGLRVKMSEDLSQEVQKVKELIRASESTNIIYLHPHLSRR
ncbi:MAG: hypothetical protein JXR73_01460 [Candidatus Omnitrophica bacterium]|nr:hypothetical protein [Candidatus Omnitrophota bacterium]